jgi:hypothetical protein
MIARFPSQISTIKEMDSGTLPWRNVGKSIEPETIDTTILIEHRKLFNLVEIRLSFLGTVDS